MTPTDVSSIITSIAALIAALGSATAVVMTLRNGRKIELVRVATDGMKEELVNAVRIGSLAAGHAEGEIKGHAAGLEQGRHERPETEEPVKVEIVKIPNIPG